MEDPTRRLVLATVAAGAVGGAGGSLVTNEVRGGAGESPETNEVPRSVPVVYADSRADLPSLSGPAFGVTSAGMYIRKPDTDGWLDLFSFDGADDLDPDRDHGPTRDFDRSPETELPDAATGGVELLNPNDESDAGAELQAILDEYGSDPLYLLVTDGEIVLEHNLLIPSNTWIRGYGTTTVFSLADGTQLEIAGILRIVDGAANVRLSEFVVDGNRENVENQGKEYGFFSKNAHNILCGQLWIQNCPGYGFDPHADDEWETTTNLRIHECTAENNGLDGITLAGIEYGTVSSCIARYNDRHGIQITDPDNRTNCLVGNTAVRNGASGIVVQNGASETVVSANVSRRNARDGIKISNTDNWSAHCSVTGNSATANGGYGISVLKATDVTVVANTVRENAVREIGNAEISLQGGTDWGATHCVVAANVTSSTDADYGIDEQPDSVGPNVIVANICDDANFTNVNRRNHESIAAFNVGTTYKTRGQIQVLPDETTASLGTSPHDGATLGGVSLSPLSSLGQATEFWVEEGDDGYRVRVDEPPGETVEFAYTIDAQ